MSALSSSKLFVCWAALALAAGVLGCSSDDDTQTTGKGGSGGSGNGGSGGEAGATGGSGGSTGGAGGSGGSGGSGGAVPPDGGVVCNGAVCPPTMFGGMTIPACCTTQNTCGVSTGTGACFGTSTDAGARPDGAGVIDPTCASLTLAQFLTLPGCCMPDNTCGFSAQGAGCVSLEQLRQLGFPGVNLPDGGPMSCVYPPPAP